MSTIKKISDLSAHGKQASAANMQKLHDALSLVPKDVASNVLKAMNIAGNASMSTIPGFMQNQVMYGLSTAAQWPNKWGFHWTHQDTSMALSAINDASAPKNERLAIAKLFVDCPDKGLVKDFKERVLKVTDFNATDLASIGITPDPAVIEQRVAAEKAAKLAQKAQSENDTLKAELATMKAQLSALMQAAAIGPIVEAKPAKAPRSRQNVKA